MQRNGIPVVFGLMLPSSGIGFHEVFHAVPADLKLFISPTAQDTINLFCCSRWIWNPIGVSPTRSYQFGTSYSYESLKYLVSWNRICWCKYFRLRHCMTKPKVWRKRRWPQWRKWRLTMVTQVTCSVMLAHLIHSAALSYFLLNLNFLFRVISVNGDTVEQKGAKATQESEVQPVKVDRKESTDRRLSSLYWLNLFIIFGTVSPCFYLIERFILSLRFVVWIQFGW